MNTTDFITTIFLENVGSASLFPFISSLTLEAMALFGGYDLMLASMVAMAGLLAGSIANWLIGFGLAALRDRFGLSNNIDFTKAERFMCSFGFIIAALFWMPVGSLFVLACGFLRVPLWKVLLAVLAGGLYHLWPYIGAIPV